MSLSKRRQKSPTLPPLLPGHQIPWEKPRPPAGDREGGTSPPGMSPGMRELFSRLIPRPFPRIPGGLSAPRRAFHSRIPLKTKHCPRCSIGNFPPEPGSPSAPGRGTVPALPDPPGDKSWDPARSQPCPRPHPADSHIPNPSWLHPRGAQLASPPGTALAGGSFPLEAPKPPDKSFMSTCQNPKKRRGERDPIWPGLGEAAAALFPPRRV